MTIVHVPRMVGTDPFMFRECVAERNVSIVFMTAALLSIIDHPCPAAFKKKGPDMP